MVYTVSFGVAVLSDALILVPVQLLMVALTWTVDELDHLAAFLEVSQIAFNATQATAILSGTYFQCLHLMLRKDNCY